MTFTERLTLRNPTPRENLSLLPRAGPRAERASAVTGSRCPHRGEGEDFLTGQPFFFLYKDSRRSGTESRKIVPEVGNIRSLSPRATNRLLPKIGVV